MNNIAKKITKRTGRAFGVSEIRDDLSLLSNKLEEVLHNYYKKGEIEDLLFNLKDELKVNNEITRKYASFYHHNEVAKNIHPLLFGKYRGINKGKDVALVACGPTLDYYDVNDKMYYVGVNRAFLKDGLKLDALFMHDKMMLDLHREELAKLKIDKFVAFATNEYNSENFNLSTMDLDNISGKRFIVSDVSLPRIDGGVFDVINPDICNGVLMDRGGGTVFSALQFVLFTEPKRIYLIGCDCEDSGYFKEAKHVVQQNYLSEINELWLEAASFIRQYYPDLEVFSINPVKLEGVFGDLYTKSYLEKHPEKKVKKSQVWMSN